MNHLSDNPTSDFCSSLLALLGLAGPAGRLTQQSVDSIAYPAQINLKFYMLALPGLGEAPPKHISDPLICHRSDR